MCGLSWNLTASTCWNPQGLSRPVMGLLYLYLYLVSGIICVEAATVSSEQFVQTLTLALLTRGICWASTSDSKWQMGFNSAFKGLKKLKLRIRKVFGQTERWIKSSSSLQSAVCTFRLPSFCSKQFFVRRPAETRRAWGISTLQLTVLGYRLYSFWG